MIQENKEKFSFFPFNEGESVEKKRAEQKVILNQEMRERSRQISQMPPVLSGSKTRENSITNRDINSEQLSPSTQIGNNTFYSPLGSPGDTSQPFSADKNQVPDSFKHVYPKFMEPHKHYAYRRLNDSHVEKVMQDAIKRIDDDVKNNEERRIKQSKEFQERFDVMIRQAESTNLMKQKDEQSLKDFQKIQMEEKAKLNKFYFAEDKKPQNIYRIRRCLVPLNDQNFPKFVRGTRQWWFLIFKRFLKVFNFYIKRETGRLFFYYWPVFK